MYAWPTKQPQYLITIILLSCSLTSRLVISRRQLLEELLDHALNPGALRQDLAHLLGALASERGVGVGNNGHAHDARVVGVGGHELLSLTVVEPARSLP